MEYFLAHMYVHMHGSWPISEASQLCGAHIMYIARVGCIEYVFTLSSGFMQVYSIKWLKGCLKRHEEALHLVVCGKSWGHSVRGA